jgi:hypothetical protein
MFAVLLALACSLIPNLEGKGPVIAAKETTVDLGDVYQGDTKTTSFTIENKGDAPLGLLRVVPKCGCTIPKLRLPATGEERAIPMLLTGAPFLELAPGEQCEITVQFNSTGQPLRRIQKEIDVESTDPNQRHFKLVLKINLLRVAHSKPEVLQLGKIMRGTTVSRSIEVWPGEGVTFDIARVAPIEHFATEVTRLERDGRPLYRIDLELLATAPLGDLSKTQLIETSIATAPPVKIPIFALVHPPVVVETGNRFNSSAVDFGVLEPGKGGSATFEITNGRPEVPYLPTAVAFDSPAAAHLSAAIEEIEKGVRYRVKVAVDPAIDLRFFKGTIKVAGDHPEAKELIVPFQGLVKK